LKTALEYSLELEDRIRTEVKARFPHLDPDFVVNHWFTRIERNSLKMVESMMLMSPEIHRVAAELRREDAKA
jgi:hypothetical protein